MQFPKQTKDMREFQNGDYVVQLNNNQNSIVLNDIVISDNSDGVRFSYLKQSGNLSLSLLDNNNNVIDTLLLTETNGKNGLISLSHSIFANEWNASIIEFSDTLKKQLKSNNVVSLRLDTKSANSSWFIDRIEPVRSLQGIELTTKSFDAFFKGFGSIFITFAVFFFAFSTIITWSYYGETAATYVFGSKVGIPYKWLFVALAFLGSIVKLDLILNLGDGLLGLVVIPNSIAILLLSPLVIKMTKDYFEKLNTGEIKPYKK